MCAHACAVLCCCIYQLLKFLIPHTYLQGRCPAGCMRGQRAHHWCPGSPILVLRRSTMQSQLSTHRPARRRETLHDLHIFMIHYDVLFQAAELISKAQY